jgi:hypothetical protein
MKRAFPTILLLCIFSSLLAAQIGKYQRGSVVRMHMGDCMLAHHGLMTALGGPAGSVDQDPCPEYTLVSDSVVYVIVGKSSNQLIPLAERIDFRLQRNEVAVRLDDAKHESKFLIKEMIVRSDWERTQRCIDREMKAADDSEAER